MADESIINEEVSDGAEEDDSQTSLINEEAGEEASKDGEQESKADSANDKADESSKKDEKESRAPDEYKDFKLPEGFEELDAELVKEFAPFAKEHNLTQEEAQQMVDLHANALKKVQEHQAEAWNNTLKSWRDETTKDEEIGGSSFQTTVVNAKKAVDVFGNEELKTVLDQSGIGNNVEVIRMFAKIGEAIGDDKMVFGKNVGDQPKSPESVLYPNMK